MAAEEIVTGATGQIIKPKQPRENRRRYSIMTPQSTCRCCGQQERRCASGLLTNLSPYSRICTECINYLIRDLPPPT